MLEKIAVTFLDAIGEGLLAVNDAGRICAVNPAACALFGRNKDSLVALCLNDVLPGALRRAASHARQDVAALEPAVSGRTHSLRAKRPNGIEFSVLANISRVDASDFRGFVVVVTNMSQLANAMQLLEEQAARDELTGLSTDRFFFSYLDGLISRGEDAELALVVINLADFATINEALGHAFGDLVLHEIAGRLRAAAGESTQIARIGGARFAVALTGVRSARHAMSQAEALLWAITGKEVVLGDRRILPRAMAGVAWAAGEIREAEGLMHAADLALRQARRASGGESWVGVYNPDMARRAQDLLVIETALMGALERNEFSLVYQPKVLLPSRRPSGVEALLRWHPSGRPPVPPDLFIPMAEQNGLIVPIGAWVIAETTRFAAEHLPACMRMSVNVSTVQFRDPSLLDAIDAALHASKLKPSRLELEITETAAMSELTLAIEAIRNMRNIGVRTAIDDFGTGYSSLSYLTRLEVDKIKIDQSLLPKDGDERMWQVLNAIIELCHAADREVLAEGVESEWQAERLAQGGCDKGQGYLFSRPMPPDALRAYLQREVG
ncbi:putative bifunctional diguanylate cyclase/phosphodiesterase [Pigmentiphaga litoralis]|uniref:putative bifunctional diguanylate cyclase/phosphodiesterase n=1 Tax=Pigmentiphaga litoralis TaxID=516702 RepID=UPI003B42CC6C